MNNIIYTKLERMKSETDETKVPGIVPNLVFVRWVEREMKSEFQNRLLKKNIYIKLEKKNQDCFSY